MVTQKKVLTRGAISVFFVFFFLRQLTRSKTDKNRLFVRTIFYACAAFSELPYNISTMVFTNDIMNKYWCGSGRFSSKNNSFNICNGIYTLNKEKVKIKIINNNFNKYYIFIRLYLNQPMFIVILHVFIFPLSLKR